MRVFGEYGDADAGTDEDAVLAEFEGLGEQFKKGASYEEGLTAACGLFEDDREFVAAGASYGVGAADTGGKECGNALQDLVADVMAEGVVDVLEGIEIDDEDGKLRTEAASTLEGAGEAILVKTAVGKAGEVVVQSEILVVFDLVF
jgi:hypothetical protein